MHKPGMERQLRFRFCELSVTQTSMSQASSPPTLLGPFLFDALKRPGNRECDLQHSLGRVSHYRMVSEACRRADYRSHEN